MNEKFTNLFAIICICIVGGIMTIPSWSYEPTKPIQSKLQVGTKTGTNQTGQQNTRPERPITKSTSTVKQGATKNTQKNDYTKQKPLGTNTVGTGTVVFVKGFPEDSMATKIATYAYKISNGDIDFLATLKAENGGFNMYQQSNVYKTVGYICNGKRISISDYKNIVPTTLLEANQKQDNCKPIKQREESYGLCQMMKKYHPEVNTKIFRESREYQVETCYKKYKGGTKFYGFNVRNRYKNDFIIR